MGTYLATNSNFRLHGPTILKKGETGIFFLCDRPQCEDTDTVSYLCEIRLPDGRRAVPEVTPSGLGMTGGLAVEARKVLFTPTSHGTHLIAIQFYNATTLTYQNALLAFHVPAWLDFVDTNVSDITKANTEISRLRTSITRTVTGA